MYNTIDGALFVYMNAMHFRFEVYIYSIKNSLSTNSAMNVIPSSGVIKIFNSKMLQVDITIHREETSIVEYLDEMKSVRLNKSGKVYYYMSNRMQDTGGPFQ